MGTPQLTTFSIENDRRAKKLCPFCGFSVSQDFRDELSRKEYKISGLCQKCQDKTFGGE
jgi:ribosomal protein L37AE/L43A